MLHYLTPRGDLMPRITVSIPEALHRKMKRHPKFQWSRIIQKIIESG
jgi:hypothetical protein